MILNIQFDPVVHKINFYRISSGGFIKKTKLYNVNQCRLINAVKSIDVDRLSTADLSACEAPDNVKQIQIIMFTLTKRYS